MLIAAGFCSLKLNIDSTLLLSDKKPEYITSALTFNLLQVLTEFLRKSDVFKTSKCSRPV